MSVTDEKSFELRNIMAQKHAGATVIAVTSGKGGVGKTNITANLAVCLAASNKKVLLLDADLGLGNLDILMNVNSRYNLWHVANGEKSLEEVVQPAPGGVEIICGASGIEEMANLGSFQRERLFENLRQLTEKYDYILIDTSAGINQSVVGFCNSSDQVLVVMTPEPCSMTDGYAMIKVMSSQNYEGKISVIVNMASNISEGKKIYRQVSDVSKRFLDTPVYDAGTICSDEKLSACVRTREPVVLAQPKSSVSTSIMSIAARLSKGCIAKSNSEGFLQKVVNWFF